MAAFLGLAVAAVVGFSAPNPAVAGLSGETRKLGTDILDTLADANKKDEIKARDILRLIKASKAKNPCPCAKSLIEFLHTTGTKSTYAGQGGTYPTVLGKCAGLTVAGSTAITLTNAVVDFWARNARGKKTEAYGKMMKKVQETRAALCKEKKVKVTALYNDFAGALTDETLLAALSGYRLPGAAPLAVGDFDGDGLRDLAVGDENEQTLKILLGRADGGLVVAAGPENRLGIGPYIVSTDDIDDDGQVDVVVLNLGTGDGSLLLGNGDGTFQEELIFDVRRGGQNAVAINLDGNAIPDHVSLDGKAGAVSVYRDGQPGQSFPIAQIPVDADADAVLPVDIDGFPGIELIVRFGGSSEVGVYPGFGNATFGLANVYAYGDTTPGTVIGDINGRKNGLEPAGLTPLGGTVRPLVPLRNPLLPEFAVSPDANLLSRPDLAPAARDVTAKPVD